jgi:hypothetical protein
MQQCQLMGGTGLRVPYSIDPLCTLLLNLQGCVISVRSQIQSVSHGQLQCASWKPSVCLQLAGVCVPAPCECHTCSSVSHAPHVHSVFLSMQHQDRLTLRFMAMQAA